MNGTHAMTLTDTMGKADFVLIDGEVFETEYLRVPDEDTLADDVVLEAVLEGRRAALALDGVAAGGTVRR